MPFRVECYAGYRGDETPRTLITATPTRRERASGAPAGERRIEVVEVLDRWLAPDHRYFKVKGDDGDVYIVRYSNAADAWELTMFSRAEPRG